MKIKTATLQDFINHAPALVIDRMKSAFKTFDEALNQIDWEAFGVREKVPSEFTQDEWTMLSDELDEMLTGRMADREYMSELAEEIDTINRMI